MKDVTYKCDLCKEKKEPAQVNGVYFCGSGFYFKDPRECETHICHDCVKQIYRIEDGCVP